MSLPVTDTSAGESTRRIDTLIIGSGFAGLGAAIKLSQAGKEFLVLERAAEVGGTWRDNTYPGAACDVPSNLYSYSFALNPGWTRSFSPQPEIQAYITSVADKYEVRRRTVFGCDVQDARWNGDTHRWDVRTTRGDFSAKNLVSAVGALCEPSLPDIAGIDRFGGEIFHSARWNHDADLTGKRVAVIGTGASAIQIVPAIAGTVAHLDVYQRTAPWVLPRADREYTKAEKFAFRYIPGFQRLSRTLQYLMRETQVVGLAKRLEEVWVPESDFPVILPRSSQALFLLQRIRDEAHRFAITFHRQKRGKSMTASVLDSVPGLGPAKQKALLKHFGSVRRLKQADAAQLQEVPGIGPSMAAALQAALAATAADAAPAVNMSTGEIVES